MNFMQAMNTLKDGQLSSVYLILGKEDYLIEQLKNQFKKLIPNEEQMMNYASFDMEEKTIDEAIEDAVSAPFFGERKVVLITNPYFLTGEKNHAKVDHNMDTLVNYLEHPMPTTVLVIVAPYPKLDGRKKVTKLVNKRSKKIDLNNFSENEIKRYVEMFVQDQGARIDSKAMDLLMMKTGANLSLMMNELPKLLLYCGQSKLIDDNAVEELVTSSLAQNVFDLVDLVLQFRSTDAIDLYHNLLINGQSALQINAILVSQFRLLLQVMILQNQGYSQGSFTSELKVHPYRIKLAVRTIHRFNFNQLQMAYLQLVKMEDQMKSGNTSPELLFEMFMIKFASIKQKK